MKIGLSAFQYFAFPNQEICPKVKTNTPIDREFHALSVSKNNFVSKVDFHLQKMILVRIAEIHEKSDEKNRREKLMIFKHQIHHCVQFCMLFSMVYNT